MRQPIVGNLIRSLRAQPHNGFNAARRKAIHCGPTKELYTAVVFLCYPSLR